MEQQSNTVRTFATGFPFFFALVFFVISLALGSVATLAGRSLGATAAAGIIGFIVQSLLALGVLAWLGWLRAAGFNGPAQWHRLHLLWLPALLALFYLLSSFRVMPAASAGVVILALIYALLTALNEEAGFRGVILQALLPYGSFKAATLSALFFGLAHLNNLLSFGPNPLVLPQVIGAFLLGFGFAACRLRTNTIWPLIVFHACTDLTVDIILFSRQTGGVPTGSSLVSFVTVTVFLVLPGLLLACYGLFLLRPRRQGKEATPADRPAQSYGESEPS